MDDVDILRELCRSVYLTSRQKDAVRRVIRSMTAKPRWRRETGETASNVGSSPVTRAGTSSVPPELDVAPLLGPGDAQ